MPRDAVPGGVRAEPGVVRRGRGAAAAEPARAGARRAVGERGQGAVGVDVRGAHLRRGGAVGAGPVRDCLENMADSVGHLRDAAQELGGNMGHAGSPGFKWHLSNVQTWCSAALTDENTCLDGLSRGVDAATRSAIRGKIVEVAQVTSNALALVNRVAPAN